MAGVDARPPAEDFRTLKRELMLYRPELLKRPSLTVANKMDLDGAKETVDVLKELPATLILRPFNFNTLAVRAYELASDERLADAATPALAIVLIGLLPVIRLTRRCSSV